MYLVPASEAGWGENGRRIRTWDRAKRDRVTERERERESESERASALAASETTKGIKTAETSECE